MKTSKLITSVAAASLALILLETKQQTALADTNTNAPATAIQKQEPAASSTAANNNEHGTSQQKQTNLAVSSSVDLLIEPYREVIPANEVGKNISIDATSQGQNDPELGWGFYWNYNAQPTIVDQNGNISFNYFFDQQGNQKQTIAKNSDGKWAVAVYAVPDAYVKWADNTRYTVADPEFQAEVATNANYTKAYTEGLNDLFINGVKSDGKSISFKIDKNNPNYQKLVQALQKTHYIFIKTVAPNYKYGDVYYSYGQINNSPNLLEAWTGKNGGDANSHTVTINQQTATIIEEIHYVDEKRSAITSTNSANPYPNRSDGIKKEKLIVFN